MVERQICIAPNMENMNEVKSMVEEMMDEAMVPMKMALQIDVVMDEILSNIVLYSGAGEIRIHFRLQEDCVELVFSDDGVPFNPLEAEAPDVTADAEEREVGGLGILITRKLMDEIRYVYENNRNKLYLMKKGI